MNLFAFSRVTCKYICNSLVRNSSIYSKSTQLETAKMSNLKQTHLEKINNKTFDLFKQIIYTEEIQYLNSLFKENGFEIRMAGGGVRDLLCHIVPNDIDFATDAKPDQMINLMSDKPNIRLITTVSGTKHGTVTARINNKVQYEITTLRLDTQTDGRHAEVEFVNDWKLDASRRDLTINSMFIDLNGVLYDYFEGECDLKCKNIRFVGNTERRIREDYLRIFRYFRFHSRFGQSGNHDPLTIATMKANLDGLRIISGERIWSEMKRILSINNCTNSIEIMFNELKIGEYLGFTCENNNLEEFYNVQRRLISCEESKVPWKPQTLFSSLIKDNEELYSVVSRLRLSNYERDTIAYILTNRMSNNHNSHLLKTQLALAPRPNQKNLKDYIVQYLLYSGAQIDLINEIYDWEIPKFPFSGTMVANRVNKRSQISMLIDELKSIWAKNNFCMNEEEICREVNRILENSNKS